MPRSALTLVILLLAALTAAGAADAAPAAPAGKAPVILLKLDDLGVKADDPAGSVSGRWKKVTSYLEGRKLKASYGILCESLAPDRPAYIAWLKERQATGLVEFWNHGYTSTFTPDPATGRKGAFEGTPLDEQRGYLTKGQELFRAKVGGDLHAFGPHVCHVDATTYAALASIPELTMVWYYGPPKGVTTDKFVFKRTINLESPIFVPNPVEVKAKYEQGGKDLPYIAMQGHPGQWNDERFAGFTATIDFLLAQGCTFALPSEFVAGQKVAAQKPAAQPAAK